MKTCPQCGRTYSDNTFAFCLEDGSVLSPPVNVEPTLVLPKARNRMWDSTLEDPSLGATTLPQKRRKAANSRSIKTLQNEYWSALNKLLNRSGSAVTLNAARPFFSISGQLGHPHVQIFASIYIDRRTICCGVRLLNRRDIFNVLFRHRVNIESEIEEKIESQGGYFEWSANKKYQTVSEIRFCKHTETLRNSSSWEDCIVWHQQALEGFYRSLHQRIKNFEKSQRKTDLGNPSTTHAWRLVEMFWRGFQSRLQENGEVSLNSPSFSNNAYGKSSMSKSYHGIRLAVQLHPLKNSADVNLTGGRGQFTVFAKLHKRRREFDGTLSDLEWRLNREGESWLLLRRDFMLGNLAEWDSVFKWFSENLSLFRKVMIPKIEHIKKRLAKP